MRIHFIVRSLKQEGAGAHQNALTYIRYLKERGHTVTVHTITSFNNPPADIQVISYAKEGLGFIAGNEFLSALLSAQEDEADIFFLYGVDCIWGAGMYRRCGGVTPVAVYLDTYLASMHTGKRAKALYYLKRLVWERLFGMRDAKRVDAYIAVSPFLKERYVRAGFPEDKFHIVPNFFDFDTKCSAQKVGVTQEVRLLYAGRLTYDKGVDLLIAAVKDLPGGIPWQLRIVGEGELEKECQDLIVTYGLGKSIEMIPWVNPDRMDEVYAWTDIFIHPARWPEPFGRIFVEAMSRGIPVIAPRDGAAPWVLGGAGIFFANGKVSGLREAIQALIRNSSLRRQLGEEGRKQAQRFSSEVVGPHLIEVLETICNKI